MKAAEPASRPGGVIEAGETSRRVAFNAAAVAAAEVAGKIATLAFTIAAARSLGQASFGAFSYALSFALLIATLPAGGLGDILVQRGSAEPQRLPELFSELLVWRTAIAVPVFGAAAIAGVALLPIEASAWAFVLVLVATFIDLYGEAGRSVAAAMQRQAGVSFALVVQRFCVAILSIAALAAGFGLVALCFTYFLGSVVGAVLVFWKLRRMGIRPDLRAVRRDSFWSMGRASIALGIDSVLALALFRLDQVILGALKGAAAVGVYAAAYKLLETVLFVSWAVARAVFPVMSAAEDRARVRRGIEQGIAAIAVLYIPFGVGVLIDARQILETLFGPAYAASGVPVLRWLAASPLLFAIGYLLSFGLVARQRRWRAAAGTLAATAVNVGLNLALIPSLGPTGAAIATTVSYGLEAVVLWFLCHKVVGTVRLELGLVVPTAASLVMAGALALAPGAIAVQVPTGVAVYSLVWYLLARWWAPEQLAVLRSLVDRRRGTRPEPAEGAERGTTSGRGG